MCLVFVEDEAAGSTPVAEQFIFKLLKKGDITSDLVKREVQTRTLCLVIRFLCKRGKQYCAYCIVGATGVCYLAT